MMRTMWTGSINFGLVNIPVSLYTAVQESNLSFDLLHKEDMGRIGYTKKCKLEDKEVKANEIVKGYEYEEDEYVILTDEDFAKADQEKTKSIEIVRFCGVDEVDSIYFEKPYYIEPTKGGDKPYALLREALKKSRRVGIAKVVFKNKEHLALIKVNHDDVLLLNLMRFNEEIRASDELHIPASGEVDKKQLDLALHLIDALTDTFKPEEFRDTYREELMRIIEEKASGRKPASHNKAPQASNVRDIMALLKASLEDTSKKSKTSTGISANKRSQAKSGRRKKAS